MPTRDAVLAKLKGAGERVTIQRQAVVDSLCELGGHQTAQAIQRHLQHKGLGIDEPTIYRILQRLKDLALVSQTDLGQSGIVYELLDAQPHHHLVCLRCGQVQDVDDTIMASLRQQLQQQQGFAARIDHMAIFGLCEGCQSSPADPP
ncbi:MAG TPA: transcriptional repressor [Phototrophicaceae bacterium]|nr:transcriptional repressor [Phototrophicaceae bacterium]